jgi:hypothetical protein
MSFFFLFITINIFQISAQNKYSINGYCSPDYTYTFAKANDNVGEFILAHKDTSMSGSFGLHAGISFDYYISDRFSIGIGVNYSKHQFNGLWLDLNVPDSLQAISPTTYKNDDLFEFVNIPLQLKYHFNENAFRFYAHTGISFQYMLTSLVYSTSKYQDESVVKNKANELEYYDRFNLIFSGGIGLAYHFSENIAIYTEPHFRYSLLSLVRDKDNSLTEHFYSIGLQTGIAWQF